MEAIHRRFGMKTVTIELPSARSRDDLPRLEKFVTNQVKETLIPAIEEVSGSKFDEENMRNIFRSWKEACIIRNKCWEFFKRKPSSWTLWDYGVSIAPIFYAMGKPESLEYYQDLLKQLEERAEKNIYAVHPDGEKYRLYWDGWLPWSFLGKVIRIMIPYGAIPIAGRYPWEFFPHPELIDPEHPVETWADLYYGEGRLTYHFSPHGTVDLISELIEDYSIDGLVMFSSKTCRIMNLSQPGVIDVLDKKYGIPGVIVEGDMIDPAMISDAQIETRLEALYEMIDSRRR